MRTALLCLLALGLAPFAHAEPMPRPLPLAEPELCQAEPVMVFRGKGKPSEPTPVALTLCDGRPNPEAARTLGVLSRPGSAAPDEAPGSLDSALLTRLQTIATHFEGRALELVSGYRPKARSSSRHRQGAAVDLRVSGIDNAELRDFARTLENTGVGYYPNSSFVHIDVREQSYYWVDLSGPGERADYVSDPESEHPEQAPEGASEPMAAPALALVPDQADMTLGLDEVEAYMAQAEVIGTVDADAETETATATATATEAATEAEAETATATETETATESESAPVPVPQAAAEPSAPIDLPAPLALPGSEPEPEPAPAPAPAPEAAPRPEPLLTLPDPDATSAAHDSGAPLALESDPDMLALALLGPPSSVELQALAGRAVHAVLAALPPSTQLDARLPTR